MFRNLSKRTDLRIRPDPRVGPSRLVQWREHDLDGESTERLDIGAIPVREDDRVVGMITDRDIAVRAVAEGRDPKNTPVREAMSRDVWFCCEDQSVESAAKLMEEKQIRRLPVATFSLVFASFHYYCSSLGSGIDDAEQAVYSGRADRFWRACSRVRARDRGG